MKLSVSADGPVDHRIEIGDAAAIDLSAVRGARQLGAPQAIGRTRSLVLDPDPQEYEIAYSVRRSVAPDRCPLWVPAAPADGVSRAVRISVDLPAGSSARATMPAFTWSGAQGTTTLGHVPAFVRLPFGPATDAAPWDIAAVMDVVTLVIFVGASGIWLWRRKR